MKFSNYNLIYPNSKNYLLVNTLTGALFEIDSIYKQIIDNNQMFLLKKEDILLYKNTGIIIEDHVNECRVLEYLLNKEKYCSKILSLTILLTWACNFACPYCFEGDKTKGTSAISSYTKNVIKEFIRKMLETNGNISVVSITLFGGEPLLEFNKNITWLKEIKELCEDAGKHFCTSIVTNGSLINPQVMQWLNELNCEFLQITLDGTREIHNQRRVKKDGSGTFDEVITGIKIALSSKTIVPLIRINIDKSNLQYIDELLIYLKNHNINMCPIDFGIIRTENTSISNYDVNCLQEDEIGEILITLWYKLKN